MNVLAFDTCLDKMYVALDKNGDLFSKIIETTKENYHSAFLISTIRDILKENDLTPQDINVVATNIGPGSFTGIRACTTVARVFAQSVFDIKTVGVSSLEILSRIRKWKMENGKCEIEAKRQRGKEAKSSANYASLHPGIFASKALLTSHVSRLTLVALDARKNMAYVAIYEDKKEILAPQALLIEDLKEMISGRQFVICDNKLSPLLGGISYQEADEDLGKILIEIAKEKLESGVETDWRKLHPLYIQPPAVNKVNGK